MSKRITVQDIADRCGLSKSTVAFALREPETKRVRPETRMRIFDTARALGYRSMVLPRTRGFHKVIGMLFPFVDGYYGPLLMALEKELERHGYRGVCSFWSKQKNNYFEALAQLCDLGVDGLFSMEYSEVFGEINKPVVIFGNPWPQWDFVCPDKERYMVSAVDYLVSRGHRRIAFIGLVHEIRARVLRQELKRRNLPFNPDWFVNAMPLLESGLPAMRQLLSVSRRPDAVILHSDLLYPGLLQAAREVNCRIPEDLSVLGYDDLPDCEFHQPGLSSFSQCPEIAANLLVQTMLERIENPELPQLQKMYCMPLIERDSVANRPQQKISSA